MAATQSFLARIVSGVVTSIKAAMVGGAANANAVPQLDNNGLLDISMFPAGIGVDMFQATASEAITAGSMVNVYSNAGVLAVRNSSGAASGKRANGFVTAAVANGAVATIYRSGANGAVTGLTPGADYWISTAASGALQTAPPAEGSGYVSQRVGTAVTATLIDILIEAPLQLT